MEAKTVPSARLDELDGERFRDMVASAPFVLLTARITAELERQRLVCERSEVPVEINRAQGAAAALRTALALPAAILGEIGKGKRR